MAIKYLYKYIYKGHDRATVTISQANNNYPSDVAKPLDEIKIYLDARYTVFMSLKVFGEFFIIEYITTFKYTKTGSSSFKLTICYISRWR